jgi:hypothetical protein
VGADREERDVAEVEETGEADDHVEPERGHRVGRREDRVVEDGAARVDDEREGDGDARGRHAGCPPRGAHSSAVRRRW